MMGSHMHVKSISKWSLASSESDPNKATIQAWLTSQTFELKQDLRFHSFSIVITTISSPTFRNLSNNASLQHKYSERWGRRTTLSIYTSWGVGLLLAADLLDTCVLKIEPLFPSLWKILALLKGSSNFYFQRVNRKSNW